MKEAQLEIDPSEGNRTDLIKEEAELRRLQEYWKITESKLLE